MEKIRVDGLPKLRSGGFGGMLMQIFRTVEVGGVKAIILCNNVKGTCIEVLDSCDPIVVANDFISGIRGSLS